MFSQTSTFQEKYKIVTENHVGINQQLLMSQTLPE